MTTVDATTSARGPTRPLRRTTTSTAILRAALESRRRAEIDRGTTLAGPHRDEWRLRLGGLESRTHASQGEQRTLALALRLGGHQLCAELTGTPPVLLLDDVFSELDESRSSALTAHLTEGQTLITTAGHVPDGVHADRVFHVEAGASPAPCPNGTAAREDDAAAATERSTTRSRSATRSRRCAPSSGCRAGDVLSTLDRRWSEIVGDDVAAHAQPARGARRRDRGRRRQPAVGDPIALPGGDPDRARERRRRPRRGARDHRARAPGIGREIAAETTEFEGSVWYTGATREKASDLRFYGNFPGRSVRSCPHIRARISPTVFSSL